MRYEQVTAHRFGPLREQSLRLAPGLNVVIGPNEAGKSSWHAALYVALCGMRRARGRPGAANREFDERYRPWDAGEWRVSAIIKLTGGRRIELHQDLAGRIDCRAFDLGLGRDCSSEIINDGAPDGARWLGLDRRAFPATACVRQADLLGCLDEPGLLQTQLQAAAAAHGTDETAAGALQRLQAFQTERIGSTKPGSGRPLRRALDRLEQAEQTLADARGEHAAYLDLEGRLAAQEAAASTADQALQELELARDLRQFEVAEQRLRHAQKLAARYPDGPPSDRADDDAFAQEVAAALQEWEARPEPPLLDGSSAADLRAELAALPPMPTGDLEVDPAAAEAHRAYQRARDALDDHAAARPPEPEQVGVPVGDVTESDLRALADAVAVVAPAASPGARRQAPTTDRRRAGLAPLALGVVALLVGVGLLALQARPIGLAFALGGTALLLAGVWRLLAHTPIAAERHSIGEQLDPAQRADTASRHLRDLGLPADPAALRALANRLMASRDAHHRMEQWAHQRHALSQRLTRATVELEAALQSRGVMVEGDPGAAMADYQQACRSRAAQAERARRAGDLETRTHDREALESATSQAAERRRAAEDHLLAVAGRCDCATGTPTETAAALRQWLARRHATLRGGDVAVQEWAELRQLLDGGDLADLERTVNQQRLGLERRVAEYGRLPFDDTPDIDVHARLAALQAERERAQRAAAELRGQLTERRALRVNVPTAEEAVAAAQEAVRDLRSLDATIARTCAFLEAAQQRVHRDIAPALAATIRAWLPAVTGNRYVDVAVDPQTLEVSVRTAAGTWRRAARLSHGTAEQVYLLLRVALAAYLTAPDEICPLLLDDVTVHCDETRKVAVLDTLHRLSQDRQIILFSQETLVANWAATNLHPPQDQLLCLDPASLPV